MDDVYKDFEDGVLTRKQMAEKYGVCPQTITNWKKKYLAYAEEKTHDDKIKAFSDKCLEMADNNIDGGINKDMKYYLHSFIRTERYIDMDELRATYDNFEAVQYDRDHIRLPFQYKIRVYLSLCCLFNPEIINDNKYFHYLASVNVRRVFTEGVATGALTADETLERTIQRLRKLGSPDDCLGNLSNKE